MEIAIMEVADHINGAPHFQAFYQQCCQRSVLYAKARWFLKVLHSAKGLWTMEAEVKSVYGGGGVPMKDGHCEVQPRTGCLLCGHFLLGPFVCEGRVGEMGVGAVLWAQIECLCGHCSQLRPAPMLSTRLWCNAFSGGLSMMLLVDCLKLKLVK